MSISISKYNSADAHEVAAIWNKVVEEGNAFPQENTMNDSEADAFFKSQTFTGVATDTATGEIVGMYILHPNNVGRCGHIANASYAVKSGKRGLHIGERIVSHCLQQAKEHGFRILQFNAVVDSNIHARHLYARLGFREVGVVNGGFRMPDGSYEDIHIMVHAL